MPLTVRLQPDAARRLRVAAARRGVTQGRLLDELLLTHLPPADPLPAPAVRPQRKEPPPLTADGLQREMVRSGITQTALAEALHINQKSVSDWIRRGVIPLQRHEAIRRFLADHRSGKNSTTKSK